MLQYLGGSYLRVIVYYEIVANRIILLYSMQSFMLSLYGFFVGAFKKILVY